jgi:5-methyltetrahydropteroyltriglutamate--homocysteine methyltransferase
MTRRYKADHVGSLLRPPSLLQAREGYCRGTVSLDQLRMMEDKAIDEAIELQRETGIDVVTDGEFRRDSWVTNVAEAVDGFVPDSAVPDRDVIQWYGPGASVAPSTAKIVGARLHQRRSLTEFEVPYLKASTPQPIKVTLPAPSSFFLAAYKPGVTDRTYATRSEMVQDLAVIIRREVSSLADKGIDYIQLDAPYLTTFLDKQLRQQLRQTGIDPEKAFDDSLAGDIASLEGLRRDTFTIGYHLCRGNSRSRWFTEGSYDPIAEKLLHDLPVDRFLLEYDDVRSGGFEPLRFVPKGKTVVLGLISTKESRLECREDLIRRVEEASKYVSMEYLALSPQCGFASVAAGNLISIDDQRRKLELVSETARQIWG